MNFSTPFLFRNNVEFAKIFVKNNLDKTLRVEDLTVWNNRDITFMGNFGFPSKLQVERVLRTWAPNDREPSLRCHKVFRLSINSRMLDFFK